MKTSMKKFGYALITAIILCSCDTKGDTEGKTITTINGVIVKNFTIDSCEYIGNVRGFTRDFLTHKGNCKFCAERSKKNCQ
jgi:hypothetical protein